MKIKLTMSGGIYGVQEFEPVDASDPEVDVPEDLQTLLRERASEEKDASGDEVRTEGQTFEFEVLHDDDTSRTLKFPESALRTDGRLKELFDCVWKYARPVASE